MAYDRSAAKARVTMTLNNDLVRRARILTPNLSGTVEHLLAGFVERSPDHDAPLQHAIDQHIEASDAFVAKYGTLADEFPAL